MFRKILDESVRWCTAYRISSPFGNLLGWWGNLEYWVAEVLGNNKPHIECPGHWPFHSSWHWASLNSDSSRIKVLSPHRSHHTCQCLGTWVGNRTWLTSRWPRHWRPRILWHLSIVTCSTIVQFAWLRHQRSGHTWPLTSSADWVPVWLARRVQNRWCASNQRCSILLAEDNRRPRTWSQYLKMFSYEISWPWAWWIIAYSRWAALKLHLVSFSFFFGNLFVYVFDIFRQVH